MSFGELPGEVLQQLVSKLVFQAQNLRDEAALDTMVGELLDLYRNNDPLSQELWLDLRDCQCTLLKGNDMQKEAGSRLERQMRNTRRGGAGSVAKLNHGGMPCTWRGNRASDSYISKNWNENRFLQSHGHLTYLSSASLIGTKTEHTSFPFRS